MKAKKDERTTPERALIGVVDLMLENFELRRLVKALAERVADQSELLAKRAERVEPR